MADSTIQNESYDLAEEWVIEQIDGQLHDEHVPRGRTVEVPDLDQCDCVPVRLSDSQGRRWLLVSAKSGGSFRLPCTRITAIYQCIGSG